MYCNALAGLVQAYLEPGARDESDAGVLGGEQQIRSTSVKTWSACRSSSGPCGDWIQQAHRLVESSIEN